MAQKYQYVEELAGNALKELTNRSNWFKYLKTAANHYKYSFRDSLLIYAQKPEASAVASFDLWNNVMHRYINKGTNGIALIDRNGSRPGLRYVFDIADTHGEKLPYIWQYKEEYADRINQELKDSFEVEGDLGDFDTIIGIAAAGIIEDNLPELVSELKYSKDNSFLEDFDDMNLEMILKNMLYDSVVTTVFLRCGYDINIDDERNYEFSQLYNFNTPDTMILLGTATSDISETLLREIELSVKTIEREQLINERGIQYGNRLQGRERIDVPGVGSQGKEGRTGDEVRTDEEELSGAELPDTVQQNDTEGGIVQPLQGERAGSETADGHEDRKDEASDRTGQMADDDRGDREYIDQGDSSGGINDGEIPEIVTETETEGADKAPFSSGKTEQIPEEDVQPDQKKRKTQAQINFSKLETLAPHIMDKRYRYAKLSADGFMDLSIEWIGSDRIAMSHYGEQNGDLMTDPDMELVIDFYKKEILPATFQNDYVGVYQEVYSGNAINILPPTLIAGISNVLNIQNIDSAVYAIDTQGTIFSWGKNIYGEIGNDSTLTVATPFELYSAVMKTITGTGNVSSTVPIVGSINALEISITHPINITYSIDPNSEDGFYCVDIQIQNNSKVPVNISIQSFKASPEGDIVFEDVLPDSYDWSNLTREETKSYIALGIKYVDEMQWMISQFELIEPLYAIQIDDIYIGTLAKEAIATLRLCGYHGLAFDKNYASKHDLVFIVSLS